MPRQYINAGIVDLEKLFESSPEDVSTLRELRNELTHRSTKKAKLLLEHVESALKTGGSSVTASSKKEPTGQTTPDLFADEKPPERKITPNNTTHPDRKTTSPPANPTSDAKPTDDRKKPTEFKLISPSGGQGKPDPWVPTLKTDLTLDIPPDASNCKRFAKALEALVTEIKREGSGQNRYELKDGQIFKGGENQNLYSFIFTSDADIFEDAAVEIEIAGHRTLGHIVSISDGKILIALDEHRGSVISHCVLLIDNTAIIEALKEKLLQADADELAFSKELADQVISKTRIAQKVEPLELPPHTLSDSKDSALHTMANNQITYLWGPPGTGKTETLSVVIEGAFNSGKRVLICSNTNQAVDQLIYKLSKRLMKSLHPALHEGKVVRAGNIILPELITEFSPFVTIEGIAKRLGEELENRKTQLQQDIALIDSRLEPIERLLRVFGALDSKEEERTIADAEAASAKENLERLIGSVEQLERTYNQLKTELETLSRAHALRKIFLRSKESVSSDIAANRDSLQLQRSALQKATSNVSELRSKLETLGQTILMLEAELADKNKVALLKDKQSFVEQRQSLLGELNVVVSKLAEIEAAILRDAMIIGTTVARSYLRAKNLGHFDLVVIDEASMVLLPALYFSAGMSKERVIISGDFRQLPPILPSQQQAIHDIIGNDAFAEAEIKDIGIDPRREMLTEQYRMTDSICKLISADMYSGKLITASDKSTASNQLPPKPFDSNLTIIDTSKLWPFESQNFFKSRFNLINALLVRNLTEHLAQHGFIKDSSSLGVCSPYAAQAALLRKLLENREPTGSLVTAGTVHRYQGDEKRMMILDIPESIGPAWGIGLFVQGIPPDSIGARLLNVAISRAQEHIIVVANLTYLEEKLPSTAFLRSVLHTIQSKGRVIDAATVLELQPVHSDLKDLLGIVELDLDAEKFGLFHQRSFEDACMQDISKAKQSIVIYSGFVTSERVASYGDLFRVKIEEGVCIRCVTRPPWRNGSIPFEMGKQALDSLEGMGVVVDCRNRIHEKIVIIDNRIVWAGSLNPLSHTARTDEFMTRTVNKGYAEQVVSFISKLKGAKSKDAASLATEAENPRCQDCGTRTSYAEGRYGPYFTCENQDGCGWKLSVKNMSATKVGKETTQHPEAGPECPECKSTTKLTQGRFGAFYSCSKYPNCKGTVKIRKKRKPKSRAHSRS